MRRALRLCAAAAVTAAAACGPGFDPPSRLLALRVIGIQSEPVAPATDEVSTLSAFVYTPPGTPAPTYAWSWCPFAGSPGDGHPCLLSEAELAMLTGGAPTPPYDLGTGETTSFENSFDPAVFEAVCTGMPGQPAVVDCSAGFPVQIKLVVTQGTAQVTAVKRLRLRFRPEHEANANPTLGALFAVPVAGGPEVELEDGPGPGPTLPRRVETVLRAEVPASSIETFTDFDDQGTPMPGKKERLILSWFTETGDVDEEVTAYIDGLTPLETATTNAWTPDGTEDYGPTTADLFVVLRDERDGVTWRRGTVTLGANP